MNDFFGNTFWLHPDFRNIRECIFSKIYKADHMHIYNHLVYETCACCYATKDPKELTTCYGKRCKSYKTEPFAIPSHFCDEHIFAVQTMIKNSKGELEKMCMIRCKSCIKDVTKYENEYTMMTKKEYDSKTN